MGNVGTLSTRYSVPTSYYDILVIIFFEVQPLHYVVEESQKITGVLTMGGCGFVAWD